MLDTSALANEIAAASKAVFKSIWTLFTELSRQLARKLRKLYVFLESMLISVAVEVLVHLYSLRHSFPIVAIGIFLAYKEYWIGLALYLMFILVAIRQYFQREKEGLEIEAATNDLLRKNLTTLLKWSLRIGLVVGAIVLLGPVVLEKWSPDWSRLAPGNPTVDSAEGPRKFRSLGACPFECCTYRDWRSVDPVKIYSEATRDSKAVTTIPSGEWVKALDGYVETNNPGTIRLLMSPTDDRYAKYNLKSGDLLQVYHNLGEGCWKTWIQGEMVDFCPSKNEEIYQPSTEWWVRVQLESGQVGWTERGDLFENVDACGIDIVKR